jgi:hypothetical protein
VIKKLFPPQFGSPWGHFDKLYGFTGTPHGLYMTVQVGKSPRLYHGNIENGKCSWKLVDESVPPRQGDYEIHPLIYDSRRDRLLQFYGTGELAHPSRCEPKVVVYAFPFGKRQWEKLDTTGYATISRGIVYNSKYDTVMLLAKKQWLVLDCCTNQWCAIDCPMPEGDYGWDSALVYDPVHNVAVSLLPAKFSGPMRVFLFRFDPATAKYKDGGP